MNMQLSKLLGHTLRQAPSEARTASHQLLLRAGMIRISGEGIYTYLPLGWRVLSKLERVVRREMGAIGGQELLMPLTRTTEEVVADLCRKEIESYRQLPTLIYQIRPRSRDEYRSAGGLLEDRLGKLSRTPRCAGGLHKVPVAGLVCAGYWCIMSDQE